MNIDRSISKAEERSKGEAGAKTWVSAKRTQFISVLFAMYQSYV